MELTFNFLDGWYVAEFEATADFNLHIEKEPKGDFYLYQRTSGGEYDFIQDFGWKKGGDDTIDYDMQALVYPKYIKIKSSIIPTVAIVSTEGDVTEIKSQSKAIEITSNGTTKVEPDAGYAYLNSVNVKVNVPTEGGGSGGNEEVGILYFNISNIPQDALLDVLSFSFLVNDGFEILSTAIFTYQAQESLEKLLWAKNIAVVYGYSSQEFQVTESEIKGYLESLGAILITEEEFYTFKTE